MFVIPLKIQTFTCPLKDSNLYIMICWDKFSLHVTQCRRNKGNTEQNIVDFSVCTNSENSSSSFKFLNKDLILPTVNLKMNLKVKCTWVHFYRPELNIETSSFNAAFAQIIMKRSRKTKKKPALPSYYLWNAKIRRKTSEMFCKVLKLTNFELKQCRISCNWFDINSHDGGIEFDKKLMIEV